MKPINRLLILSNLALLLVLAQPARAQLFGNITDAPSHAFAVGVGVGPTSNDYAVYGSFAERIISSTATYSYSGVSFVPTLITNANHSRSLVLRSVVHTGLEQPIYQADRLTVAVNAGGGASLPNAQTTGFDFAAVTGLDVGWRLNKAKNSMPGGANNHLTFAVRLTQTSGVANGTTASIGVGLVHAIN
jgi:hypothetical protein